MTIFKAHTQTTMAQNTNQQHTLFVSDVHLNPLQADLNQRFFTFLQQQAIHAEALYILGDCFDLWVGANAQDELQQKFASAIQTLTKSGVPVYFMHGNHDFLLGSGYAKRANMTLLPDPSVIELYGQRWLLCHGDSLCTLDHKHQRLRYVTRNPLVQKLFLCLPYQQRKKFGNYLQKKSRAGLNKMTPEIMDVTQSAVEKIMQKYQVINLIHGHTHRPNIHYFTDNQQSCRRIVLGAWHQQNSLLSIDTNRDLMLVPHKITTD